MSIPLQPLPRPLCGFFVADALRASTLTKPDPFSLTRMDPLEAQVVVVSAA